jgi:hypothetical protein
MTVCSALHICGEAQHPESARAVVAIPAVACRNQAESVVQHDAHRELLIVRVPLYLMKPSLRNLFMNTFTRDRVVPTISASVSWEIFGSMRWTVRSSP